mmetsp:Transcript_5666/g.13486  ORF Transcript_5666/g.13486 Transcript_5666/m.13486 type:complete len:225 (+) Transcript_5666:72-746(+)
MARNEEKAMAALNRWVVQKKHTIMGDFGDVRRPRVASEVTDLKACKRWRADLIKEIGSKIGEIQNAGLGEHRIRDLNDEINKLLREKVHWETQIRALGGPLYVQKNSAALDAAGIELPSSQQGYKYFGAAKDLPGVRELFEREDAPAAPRRTRKQMFQGIKPDYYGWRDEEDGMLLLTEHQCEAEAQDELVRDWQAQAEAEAELREEANNKAAEPPAKKAKIGT